jgi:hypothetical protein
VYLYLQGYSVCVGRTYERQASRVQSSACGAIKEWCHSKTTCSKAPLRLTVDHLVYTEAGLRAVSTLLIGDVLAQMCIVKSVALDPTEQAHFGLNCLQSNVLANGIKTSMFSHYYQDVNVWPFLQSSRCLDEVDWRCFWNPTCLQVGRCHRRGCEQNEGDLVRGV